MFRGIIKCSRLQSKENLLHHYYFTINVHGFPHESQQLD